MPAAALPLDEAERLAALRALGILDTPPEDRFDRITRLATHLFNVEVALVSLVDANRQWFKSCIGLPGPETPRAQSFCAHAILEDEALVIPDATKDVRFADNPLVTGNPYIRFYAGKPLRGPTGHKLGTLCLIDPQPRELSPRERLLLDELANIVESEFATVRLEDAVAELHRARTRLRTVMEAAVEGIVELDADGVVTFINPAAAAALGYDPSELLGRELHRTAHHSHADGTAYPIEECPTHRTLRGGRTFRSAEEIYWRRDGTPVPIELTTAPIVEDGQTTGAVVTFSDITARRELERMKDDFVASVSHELRTPLTSIKGYIELVSVGEAGALNDQQRDFLGVAYRNAAKLEALINDLLLVSRFAAGAIELRRERVDLAAVAAQVLEQVRPTARAKGVHLDATLAVAPMDGDTARLHQAVANLVSNAIKFTPSGRTVTVATSAEHGAVSVEVTDEGVGIPAEELPQIMQRFFRASTAQSIEGTGLGLVITREIVEAHGGSVDVESRVGEGSVFSVRLPAAG